MRKSIFLILFVSLNLAISSNVFAEQITIQGISATKLLETGHKKVSFTPKTGGHNGYKISANGTTTAQPVRTYHSDNDNIPSTSQESFSTPASPLLAEPIKLTKLNLEPLVVVERLNDRRVRLQSPHVLIKSITLWSVGNPTAPANEA